MHVVSRNCWWFDNVGGLHRCGMLSVMDAANDAGSCGGRSDEIDDAAEDLAVAMAAGAIRS